MTTLFAGIVTLLGLVIAGFFVPVLWIVAAVLLVVVLLYLWQASRSGARRAEEGR